MQFGQREGNGPHREGRNRRHRISPLGCGYGAAAVVVAATGGADDSLFGFFSGGIVAVMRFTNATGMRGLGCGCHRQRNEAAGEGEQQQEFGGQALHASVASIEQTAVGCKVRCGGSTSQNPHFSRKGRARNRAPGFDDVPDVKI
jgi:hypothetical protein